ncbi:MAG TPA: universal stress protein [Candidatus Baltobacteraceae bacterium]
MFKHILCPIDGSQGSLQALDIAATLAAEQHATLTICTVVDAGQAAAMAFGDPGMSAACYNALEDEHKQALAGAAARIAHIASAGTRALNGPTVPAIVEYAKRNSADLIVTGSHGRSGISRALLGSVAEGILRHAPAPVMVVRWSGRAATAQSRQAAAATGAV